ncbi:hypothetical protein D3C78_1122570 [compost metagenome]
MILDKAFSFYFYKNKDAIFNAELRGNTYYISWGGKKDRVTYSMEQARELIADGVWVIVEEVDFTSFNIGIKARSMKLEEINKDLDEFNTRIDDLMVEKRELQEELKALEKAKSILLFDLK